MSKSRIEACIKQLENLHACRKLSVEDAVQVGSVIQELKLTAAEIDEVAQRECALRIFRMAGRIAFWLLLRGVE